MTKRKKTDTKTSESCEFDNLLAKTALNSLSAHIAILDKDGTILETNRAWQDFARGKGTEPPPPVYRHELSPCMRRRRRD